MSASGRFAAWVRAKLTQQAPLETPQEPPTCAVGPYKPSKTQKPPLTAEAVSVYPYGSVVHVVFNHNRRLVMKNLEDGEQPTRSVKREKDYISKVDPITRRIQKIKKDKVGDISSVRYYDEKGHLIE